MIRGERLALQPIRTEDLPDLWEMFHAQTDAEWRRFDAPYFPRPVVDREKFCAQLTDGANYRRAIWIDRRIIGTVSYYWEDEPSLWLEAGIVITDPGYWSQGYGTEALTLWITHLFDALPVVRIGMTTWSGNPRMMRVAEKLGFRLEGRLRKVRRFEGEHYDSLRYGVLREEWDPTALARAQLNRRRAPPPNAPAHGRDRPPDPPRATSPAG